jgi:cation diffusion facilitator CzcD-associated flavoprotein CzcO
MERKSVAIVGAGASGLVAAKVLLEDGFNVTVFDRQRELGGVWSAESAYADLRTQQPAGTMEFSDLFDGEGRTCSLL